MADVKNPVNQGSETYGSIDLLLQSLRSPEQKPVAPLPEIVSAPAAAPQNMQGLSLYDTFMLTRTAGEKEELSHSANSKLVEELHQFLNINPKLRDMIIMQDGRSLGRYLKEYNPDKDGPAKIYFAKPAAYQEDPERHISAQETSLWDQNLANYRHTSEFGPRPAPKHGASTFHEGIDFATPIGTDLHSEGETQVAFAGRAKGYGNAVILNQGDGVYTLYGHLDRIQVKKGQILEDGQKFADTGRSGTTTGPNLHMEVLVASKGHLYAIDPNLVSDGQVDLRTEQGRAAAVEMSARLERVSVQKTESHMAMRILPQGPEPRMG